jgi:hypothetical protein
VSNLGDLENRFTYHAPTAAQVPVYEEIRAAGLSFALLLDRYAHESRELSLAVTHVEEAVMWANAAVARHGLVGETRGVRDVEARKMRETRETQPRETGT